MSWRTVVRAAQIFAFLLAVAGCKDSPTEPGGSTGPGTVSVSGTVQIPAGRDANDLRVVAGFNEGRIRNGRYEIKLNENAVQLVTVVSAANEPVLLSLNSLGTTASTKGIDARTTAEALVFLNPYFVTSDPAEADDLLATIRGLQSLEGVVNTVTAQLAAGSFSITESNQALVESLGTAFVEIQRVVSPTSMNAAGQFAAGVNPDFPVNGLEIISFAESAGNLSFAIRNSRKRWISVYVDGSMDGESYVSTGGMLDLIPSPSLSILGLLRERSSSLTAESKPLSFAMGNYRYAAVKTYGLGIGYNLTDGDFERAILPGVASIVFDLGIPFFEVLSGFKISQDLRGRPLDHPFYPLVQEAVDRILMDQVKKVQFYRWYREGDVVAITADLVKSVFVSLAYNPRAVTDLLSQIVGRSLARSTVDMWLWPIRVYNATLTSVNLGISLASVISTEIVTTFVLTSESIGTVRVQGTVLNAAGSPTPGPLSGATVTAFGEMDNQLGVALTNSSGLFDIRVPAGRTRVRVWAAGYRTVNQVFDVTPDANGSFVAPSVYLTPYSSTPGTVRGTVRDATTLQPLSGVSVTLRFGVNLPNEEIVQTTTTASNGGFEFADILQGTYTAYFHRAGYVNDHLVVPVQGGTVRTGNDMALVPNMQTGSGYRIVLTWGLNPRDLDSHLYTPPIGGVTYHIYYFNRGRLTGPPYVNLDVDDTSSYGPETVTIASVFPGEYSFAVHHFAGTGALITSEARVSLYGTGGHIRTWNVPVSGSGNWWSVFRINGSTGAVTSINTIGNSATASTGMMALPPKVQGP